MGFCGSGRKLVAAGFPLATVVICLIVVLFCCLTRLREKFKKNVRVRRLESRCRMAPHGTLPCAFFSSRRAISLSVSGCEVFGRAEVDQCVTLTAGDEASAAQR